jgi:hypothetical protein
MGFEYYPGFNSLVMEAIWKAIGNFDDFAVQALTGPSTFGRR